MYHLTDNHLNPIGCYVNPIHNHTPKRSDIDLFDQNGYDLSDLEQKYCLSNSIIFRSHRPHRHAIKHDWMIGPDVDRGAHLNHALLFERKGFAEEAYQQLEQWCKQIPVLYKVLRIRPKWGIDISIDYCDTDGNVFEVLHYEYDGFDYNEIVDHQKVCEELIVSLDWNDVARRLLRRKDRWHHLGFFEQSRYKCSFVGLGEERFKMVLWE